MNKMYYYKLRKATQEDLQTNFVSYAYTGWFWYLCLDTGLADIYMETVFDNDLSTGTAIDLTSMK